MQDVQSTPDSDHSAFSRVVSEGQKRRAGLLRSIVSRCQTPGRDRRVVLLVYLDEAQVLARCRAPGWSKSLYDTFLSAFVTICGLDGASQGIFLVTVSTKIHVAPLPPSPITCASARGDYTGSDYLAPYTELPFDLLPSGKHVFTSGEHTVADAAAFEFVVQFGRPLWVSFPTSRT